MMPPSAKGSQARLIRTAYLQWECLRRNKQYAADFESLYACDEAVLRRARYPEPGYWDRLKNQATRKRLIARHLSWGVSFMAKPVRIPLNDMIRKSSARDQNPFWSGRDTVIIDNVDVQGPDLVQFTYPGIDLQQQRHWHVVAINVGARKNLIEASLKKWQKAAAAENRRAAPGKRLRYHETAIEKCLAAWDKYSPNKPPSSLAAQLYPEDAADARAHSRAEAYRNNAGRREISVGGTNDEDTPRIANKKLLPSSLSKRVRRQIAAAKKLIHGDYQLLS